MHPLPAVIGLATAVTVGAGVLAPAAQADTGIDLAARLQHSAAHRNAAGHSDYERGAGREVEVTVRHVPGLAGKRVIVYVNHHKVGTMRVNRYGVAHREWDTDRGQYVPYATADDRVRVRTTGGTLVASGRYHRVND